MTRALVGIPAYPRQLTYAPTSQDTLCRAHFTAPSAVHLTTCFLPDSQHHRLSVKASLPLSPLQRFNILNLSILYHPRKGLPRGDLKKFPAAGSKWGPLRDGRGGCPPRVDAFCGLGYTDSKRALRRFALGAGRRDGTLWRHLGKRAYPRFFKETFLICKIAGRGKPID